MSLIHCIYASRAIGKHSEAEVQSLLEQARYKNESLGITGMLLLVEDSFFQVLEGEADTVDALYQRISTDPRHDRVTQIIRESIPQRSFGDWSMGFEAVDRAKARELAGGNDFFAAGHCLEDIQPGRARKLLTAFRSGRWRTDRTGVHRAHVRVG